MSKAAQLLPLPAMCVLYSTTALCECGWSSAVAQLNTEGRVKGFK
jgi:hypothetical protein